MDTLDKGMIDALGRTECEGSRAHYTAQKGAQLRTHGLFICVLILVN